MNSQPNQTEHPPGPTDRRRKTLRQAYRRMKVSSQPDDYNQRADLHSLNSLLGAPMEIGRFLPLTEAITVGLKEVHQDGLIHKDIKPDNILVSETGDVKFTGFDLASCLPRERQLPTPPEFIAGTLAYMAPEQTGRADAQLHDILFLITTTPRRIPCPL